MISKKIKELIRIIIDDKSNKMDFVMYDNNNYIETNYEGLYLVIANRKIIVKTKYKEYVYKDIFNEKEYKNILKRSRKIDINKLAITCSKLGLL